MLRKIRAAVIGYLVLVVVYIAGVLLAWVIIGEGPFGPEEGGITSPWVVALLMIVSVAAFVGGWVCRRVSRDSGAVVILIGVLIGLALVVMLTDVLIGPTPSARAFLETLFGPVSIDDPLAELLDGRPQMWFAVASYLLAGLAIVVGAKVAEMGPTGQGPK